MKTKKKKTSDVPYNHRGTGGIKGKIICCSQFCLVSSKKISREVQEIAKDKGLAVRVREVNLGRNSNTYFK